MKENLLVELLVEELPPRALRKLGEAFGSQLLSLLRASGLAGEDSVLTTYATPRRLAAHITELRAKAADEPVRHKLMPVDVGLTPEGKPTAALLKKLAALGASEKDVSALVQEGEGKGRHLALQSLRAGVSLHEGLQKALSTALTKLPIPKVMTYQLHQGCDLPGWDSVQFVRPAHALVALHGADVVPVRALGLTAGRTTLGHRFEARVSPLTIANADSYAQQLEQEGAVIASFDRRRQEIVRQIQGAAQRAGEGLQPIDDEALLDEVTALVERPNVLQCKFDEAFLLVPQECLILTMKANQKYFPLLQSDGRLSNVFLVVSNITPEDPSAVIEGNERVVRPRLADAQFFFNKDRSQTLISRLPALQKVVYHNQLGSQGERVERVRAIAALACEQLALSPAATSQADLAAQLAKADLLTDMVGEFPELQGVMGRYYALSDGLEAQVANAIEEHYKPRFAGDSLPASVLACVCALADKLETLVGMFGIGKHPTGEKDPFALRRHALGVIRILVEKQLRIDLAALFAGSALAFGPLLPNAQASNALLMNFIDERALGYLQGRGYSLQEAEAVLAARAPWPDLPKALDALRAFAKLPQGPSLAAANKRIGNILKKAADAQQALEAHVSETLLQESAEKRLYAAMRELLPRADSQFEGGDYSASLQTLAALSDPVDAFFEGVMVNVEDTDLRLNRQGLLKRLHQAMNRVAELSRLAA